MNCKKEKRILCVGITCIDILCFCDRYPEEDSDESVQHMIWARGGNASNDCTLLSQFGVPCEVFSPLSDDCYLDFIKKDLNDCAISYENCLYFKNRNTAIALVVINQAKGTRTAIFPMKELPKLTVNDFKKLDFSNYKWIHFEERDFYRIDQFTEAIDQYNSLLPQSDRITISLEIEDVGSMTNLFFFCGDIIFISKDVALRYGFTNMQDAAKGFKKFARPGKLFFLRGTVICPWGEHGACACSPDGELITSPAFPPDKIRDTLGAGDTFDASVIYALSNGQSLQDAITLGCKVAGKKCGILGLKNILPL